MKVNIPDSIRSLEPALAEFFDGMAFKLHVNAHKSALSEDDIPGLIDKMVAELQEFRDQLAEDGRHPNTLAELWDIANFSFLLYAFLRKNGVMTLRESFIEEFYDVVPELGRVFCVKSRSGSRYRPGDEITGTLNSKGEVLIRTQNAAGGFAVTLPRSHLIWWKSYGEWPNGRIVRVNNDPKDDNIRNLNCVPEEPGDFPFVSQYKPKGRENTANYGKFIYQRRHLFQLIRCGYWDTREEAAVEGLKAWKKRTLDITKGHTDVV